MKIGFPDLLTLVFITLKLTGVIDWNWFLVLLPLILELVAIAILLSRMINESKK